jgi:hypothetical protein
MRNENSEPGESRYFGLAVAGFFERDDRSGIRPDLVDTGLAPQPRKWYQIWRE